MAIDDDRITVPTHRERLLYRLKIREYVFELYKREMREVRT